MRKIIASFALAAAAALMVASRAPSASACAILPTEGDSGPRLSVERVAILYDDDSKIEHFVREVRFSGAAAAFAFVVPTPSKPELASVKAPPFDALEEAFPLEPPADERGGEKSAAAPTGVEVLSTQRIGSFTAFVLAANDAAALDHWMKENRIALPPGAREWLDHYVGLKFFFTAFRYEAPEGAAAPSPPPSEGNFASPPGGQQPTDDEPPPHPPGEIRPDAKMTSETVRISFRTPVPFYPYLEPAFNQQTVDPNRAMLLWVISRKARYPRLRRVVREKPPRWAFPWEARMAYEKSADEVLRPLGEIGPLLPGGKSYHVQTFLDFRSNRDGWSDVLLPDSEDDDDDGSWRSVATSFLGDLDHPLTVGVLEPAEPENEAMFRVPPRAGGCGCRAVEKGGDLESALAIGAAGIVVALRRRSRHNANMHRRRI